MSMRRSRPDAEEKFNERFHGNERIDGAVMGNVHVHMPCLFCGAPDFIVYEILQVTPAVVRGGVCNECKRGARALIDQADGIAHYRWVQTCGPDVPDWHPNPMPRVT